MRRRLEDGNMKNSIVLHRVSYLETLRPRALFSARRGCKYDNGEERLERE